MEMGERPEHSVGEKHIADVAVLAATVCTATLAAANTEGKGSC